MAGKEKYKVSEIKAALEEGKGFLTKTASILKCSLSCVYNYLDRHPTLKEAYEMITERQIDFVESQLFKKVKEGDTASIIFFLKTRAKHRGYVERTESRTEIFGKMTTGALVVPSDMTPEEWEATFCSEPGGNGDDPDDQRKWE